MLIAKQKCSGFSLIEVMSVLAISIIIALLVFPYLRVYSQNIQLKNSTKQLVEDLRQMQQNAVTEQVKFSIRLTPLTNSYETIKKTNPETILSTKTIDANVIFSIIEDLPDNEIIFNSAGAVDFSGNVYLEHLLNFSQTVVHVHPAGFINWENYVE